MNQLSIIVAVYSSSLIFFITHVLIMSFCRETHAAARVLARASTGFYICCTGGVWIERREREREERQGAHAGACPPVMILRIVMHLRGRLARSSALYFHWECVTSSLDDLVARIELVAKCARPFEIVRSKLGYLTGAHRRHAGCVLDFEPVGRRD